MQFWKISPSGNPTILIPAAQAPLEQRARLAATVMSQEHLGADQVGFYSPPTDKLPARLDMMGGEFCLNATRALAFLLAHMHYFEREGQVEKLSVSGLKEPALCSVLGDSAKTALDFAILPKADLLAPQTWLLRLPGIKHIVYLDQKPPQDGEAFCRSQLQEYGLGREDAVGFIWLDEQSRELTPLVWVRQTASLIRESACGSGSLACALLLHERLHLSKVSLKQPSGHNLDIEIEKSDLGFRVWVGGPVRLLAMGELFV